MQNAALLRNQNELNEFTRHVLSLLQQGQVVQVRLRNFDIVTIVDHFSQTDMPLHRKCGFLSERQWWHNDGSSAINPAFDLIEIVGFKDKL